MNHPVLPEVRLKVKDRLEIPDSSADHVLGCLKTLQAKHPFASDSAYRLGRDYAGVFTWILEYDVPNENYVNQMTKYREDLKAYTKMLYRHKSISSRLALMKRNRARTA